MALVNKTADSDNNNIDSSFLNCFFRNNNLILVVHLIRKSLNLWKLKLFQEQI